MKLLKVIMILKKARQKIIETVKEKFGYTIEQEPVEIGSNKE